MASVAVGYYVGGKLDLTIVDVAAASTVNRGRPFRVLVDKDGIPGLREQESIQSAHPDAAAFDERLNWSYAAALMCAKAIVRDEPWSAKMRDRDLKDALLLMIEWDHRARYGLGYDVRFSGSRMRQWMDADVQRDLDHCWGHFDAADAAASLRESITLLARVSTRVAALLGFQFFDHDRIHTEIETILAQR